MSGSTRYTIVPIVEGHGEVEAVPALLNRWFQHRNYTNFGTPREATRGHKGSMTAVYDPVKENGIELYVRRAAARRPDAILVILDSDDLCLERINHPPHEQLGPELLKRAVREVGHIPIAVVVANREFEAWFLAGYKCMQLHGKFLETVQFPADFEAEKPRNCKGRVAECLGRSYSPTTDQKDLVKYLGFGSSMTRKSRSFRKLLKDLETLAKRARQNSRVRMRRDRKAELN